MAVLAENATTRRETENRMMDNEARVNTYDELQLRIFHGISPSSNVG